MLRRCMLAVLVAALAPPLLAQKPAPPDLSGTWVLRTPKPDSAILTEASQTIAIARSEKNVEVRTTTNGRETIAHYVADGKPREVPEFWQELDTESVTARWQGTSLVLKYTRSIPMLKQQLSRTERWTLSPDGKTLTVSRDELMTLTFLYDRQ